jgi:SAM-dependent methyltransferase
MSQSTGQFPRYDLSQRDNWRRVDESEDGDFYRQPRLVVHVDNHFITTLGKFLLDKLPPGADILDLMSSFKSHIPAEYPPGVVTGLGLNRAELQANEQLDEYVVHDLNRDQHLPFKDASFEVVLNTVSVQYMLHPVEVFQEVGRLLKPGGLFIVSFSNRMFYTKAIQLWRDLDEKERTFLVMQYFIDSDAFQAPQIFYDMASRSSLGFLDAIFGVNDPVYIVWGQRRF